MNKLIFNRESRPLIDKLQILINIMPNKGNTCENSQKVCLQTALNKLERIITGLDYDDFDEIEDREG